MFFWLLVQVAWRAFSRAWENTGNRIAAKMAIIAITTKSSIRVKPRFIPHPSLFRIDFSLPLRGRRLLLTSSLLRHKLSRLARLESLRGRNNFLSATGNPITNTYNDQNDDNDHHSHPSWHLLSHFPSPPIWNSVNYCSETQPSRQHFTAHSLTFALAF